MKLTHQLKEEKERVAEKKTDSNRTKLDAEWKEKKL
jgi:hypothetical protein